MIWQILDKKHVGIPPDILEQTKEIRLQDS